MDTRSDFRAPTRRIADETLARLQLGRRRLPVVLQCEVAECGLACLAMIAGYHGHSIDVQTLRAKVAPSGRGATLSELIDVANGLHLTARALKVEMADLTNLRTPCVLHWDMSHFVVLRSVRRGQIIVHDPAYGVRSLSFGDVSRHFTGVALECVPAPKFEPKHEVALLRLRDLWRGATGLLPALLHLLALSALLQLLGLGAPFYTQVVVDQVLTKLDLPLLNVLAAGFLGLLVMHVVTQSLRDYSVIHLSALTNLQLSANLMSHLIRLPQSYFSRRHLGDILSRFSALEPIRSLLTTGLLSALLDGGLALTTLGLLVLYSPSLAAVVAGTSAAYAIVRILSFAPMRQLAEEEIVAGASEQTHLIETVRAIQAVKLFTLESEREADWQNLRAKTMNAGIRSAKWGLGLNAANGMLFGVQRIGIVYLAARMVMNQSFTVGMLYAFLAYQSQFTSRMIALIDAGIQFWMARLHLARLADIALTPEESRLREASLHRPEPGGTSLPAIEFRGVSFRYGRKEGWILREVSFCAGSGELTVITGVSGAGKSTLLRLLLGLLEPTSGEILLDGVPLRHLDKHEFRRSAACVMQDDHIFSGTILENITCFDPVPDVSWAEACARSVCLSAELAAMPLGYQTRVTDLGSIMSGGQRQRLLLARALYRRPRVLVIDEGTAHLDPGVESQIVSELARHGSTRIVVTHRSSTLECHGQHLHLERGGYLAGGDGRHQKAATDLSCA